MAVYNQVLTYTFRDSLASGNPAKIIFGAYLDGEFGAIHTASLDAVSLSQNNTIAGSNSFTGTNTFSGNSITTTFQGKIVVGPPSAGMGLTVTGLAGQATAKIISGTNGAGVSNDLEVDRPGSTANLVGQGPNLVLNDTTNSTDTMLQMAGGQTELWQFNGSWVQQWRITTGGVLQARDQGGAMQDVGWRGTPINALGSGYTLTISDRGKTINSGGFNVTVPNAVFSAGDVISVLIGSGASCSIIQGSGVTLQWAGNGATTGTRTLTGAGLCTVVWASSSVALITGPGLS